MTARQSLLISFIAATDRPPAISDYSRIAIRAISPGRALYRFERPITARYDLILMPARHRQEDKSQKVNYLTLSNSKTREEDRQNEVLSNRLNGSNAIFCKRFSANHRLSSPKIIQGVWKKLQSAEKCSKMFKNVSRKLFKVFNGFRSNSFEKKFVFRIPFLWIFQALTSSITHSLIWNYF